MRDANNRRALDKAGRYSSERLENDDRHFCTPSGSRTPPTSRRSNLTGDIWSLLLLGRATPIEEESGQGEGGGEREREREREIERQCERERGNERKRERKSERRNAATR